MIIVKKSKQIRMGKIIELDLPFTLPKKERKEMTFEQKKEFYAQPLDVQLYYRQFNPPLGEPQIKKPDDYDDDVLLLVF